MAKVTSTFPKADPRDREFISRPEVDDFVLIDPDEPTEIPPLEASLYEGDPKYVLASDEIELFLFCLETSAMEPRKIESAKVEPTYFAFTDDWDIVQLSLDELKWRIAEDLTLNGHPVIVGPQYWEQDFMNKDR